VQLLITRSDRAQCELVDAIAQEAGVGVAVDEARYRAETGAVELLDLALDPGEVPHPPNGGDAAAFAERERLLDHVDRVECFSAQRRLRRS
jgi:hypothetical protein